MVILQFLSVLFCSIKDLLCSSCQKIVMKLKKVFFTALIFWNWMRSSSKLCYVLLILGRSGRKVCLCQSVRRHTNIGGQSWLCMSSMSLSLPYFSSNSHPLCREEKEKTLVSSLENLLLPEWCEQAVRGSNRKVAASLSFTAVAALSLFSLSLLMWWQQPD